MSNGRSRPCAARSPPICSAVSTILSSPERRVARSGTIFALPPARGRGWPSSRGLFCWQSANGRPEGRFSPYCAVKTPNRRAPSRLLHKSPPGVTATRVSELSHGWSQEGPPRLRRPTQPDCTCVFEARGPGNPETRWASPVGRRLKIDQDPAGEALILMSTPAGKLSLLRASIVLLVG